MKPLRIAIIAPSPSVLGGQSVQARLLMERLNSSTGFQAELIPINPRLPGALRVLQKPRYIRTALTSALFLTSLIRRLPSYDVVHIFSASYFSFVLAPSPALVISRLFRKPSILNYHSGEADDHFSRWRTAIPTVRLATRVITPSMYLVDLFAKHGLSAFAISNFVDLDRFSWRLRDPLRPVFLSNRSFQSHYDVSCVLRAFALIQAQRPDARLLVAGDGPLKKSLWSLTEELGLKNVEFLGGLAHPLMPEVYDRADIYLNASFVDNMPLSILEAHACGLPVVTSAAGGIPYIVRDQETGLLTPAHDPEGIAAAALRLLSEPELARSLAVAGRRDVEKCHSWDRVESQWMDLYSALGGRVGDQLILGRTSASQETLKVPAPDPTPSLRESGKETEKRPLRVALIAPSLDVLGGQSVQANLLEDQLNQVRGVKATLLPINPRMPKPFGFLLKVKYLRTFLTSILYLGMLLARLRSFDVLHVFSASYFSFVLAPTPALALGRLFGRPTILNYRSGEADDHLKTWSTAVPTIRLATRVITPSDYLVDVFGHHGVKASAIPNFVDLTAFAWRERNPIRPVFLSNRNFEAHYDVACVLRAFALIQNRRPDASLIVVGDGPLRKEIHTLRTELGLRNVEFCGRVAHAGMPGIYNEADIYLNTPYIDNMPNSILEAYACGLPVVTSDAGGIPYIVRDHETGLMVPARDHRAVAAAALRLLSDPELVTSLSLAGRREVEERYSWERVKSLWIDLYKELAERGTESGIDGN